MSSACRSATCSVDMARPDPWLEHYGAARGGPRRARRLIAVALAALAVIVAAVAIGLARRDHGWHPPKGVAFHACTHGNRVAARCAQLRVPEDASRPDGRTISLHVAVIPATRQPARGALFYLEGGPGGVATRRRGQGRRGVRERQRVPRPRARRSARDGPLARARVSAGARAGDRRGRGRGVLPPVLRPPRRRGAAADERGRGRRHRARPAGARLRADRHLRQLLRRHARRSSTRAAIRAPCAPSRSTAARSGASRCTSWQARNAERALRAGIARCHTPRTACLRAFPRHRGRAGAPAGRRTRGAPTGSRRRSRRCCGRPRTPRASR